jgi:hypothetical protein
MKAAIRDTSSLQSLRPLEVAAYLRAEGWTEVKSDPGRVAYWEKTIDGDGIEITLPLDPKFRDYPRRIAEAIEVLEIAEKRSQLEILNDLTVTLADVHRVRLQAAGSEDGTLAFSDGVRAYQQVRDMISAAACSAISPRACFRTRKPTEADAYLRKLRLGQSERGSYVMTVLSPVTPALTPETAPRNGVLFETEEPFERRAMTTLAHALEKVRVSAERAGTSGHIDSFSAAVREGVSSNLCAAVAGIVQDRTQLLGLSFEFTWSRARPQLATLPARIVIPPDALPIIEEAGRMLSATAPTEEFELHGIVVTLHRTGDQKDGKVTVLGLVEGELRKVQLVLSETDYEVAIKAHQERAEVVCLGDLLKEGRSFELQNPRGFQISPQS